MPAIEQMRTQLPDEAKDHRVNLQNVLQGGVLTDEQVFGTALTSAYFIKCTPLVEALKADMAEAGISDAIITDAKSAAAIMAMNATYYRTRHLLKGNKEYANVKPGLRMQGMMTPATNKGNYELFAMACAVLAGCEMCLGAHDQSLRKHEFTTEQIHEAIRIASVINAVSVSLELE